MKFLKLFDNKAAAIGEKIPSPCAAKYEEEDEVDYFRPMGQPIVSKEVFTIESGETGPYVSEYCDIHDAEVLRIVAQKYGTNGLNPKISDVYFDNFTANHLDAFSGNTVILDINGLGPVLSNCTDYSKLFSKIAKVRTIDVSDIDFSRGTKFRQMFNYCYFLSDMPGINDMDLSSGEDFTAFFQGLGFSSATANISVDVSKWNIPQNAVIEGMFNIGIAFKSITGLENIDVSSKASIKQLFFKCLNCEEISDVSNWDTYNITNMYGVFAYDSKLAHLDVSKWKTDNNTTFNRTFRECAKLTTVGDLSSWKVSNVTSFNTMFYSCYTLTNIGNLSNWNTENCEDFGWMFYHCDKLRGIGNCSNWDTSNSTVFKSMFCYDYSIENMDEIASNLDFSLAESYSATQYTFFSSSLQHSTFPQNLKSIGQSMYGVETSFLLKCPQIKDVDITIPNSVNGVYEYIYQNQYNIKGLHFGSNLQHVNDFFSVSGSGCQCLPLRLSSVTIDSQNQYLKTVDNIIYSKDGKILWDGANRYWTSQTDMIIPEGTETIASGAFEYLNHSGLITSSVAQQLYDKGELYEPITFDTSLTGITFPSTIKYIGKYAFARIMGVKSIKVLTTTPPTLAATNFATSRDSDFKIYVPSASVSAYKAATTWSSYASIIEAIPNS